MKRFKMSKVIWSCDGHLLCDNPNIQVKYVALYKHIVKKMVKMHKGRVAPMMLKSEEHLNLRNYIDEQYELGGF